MSRQPRGRCRFCGAELTHTFADLGMSPIANHYLTEDQLSSMEPFFPLHALACDRCFLVQLEEFETPEAIFSDYSYFSSYSTSWLDHCRSYVEMASERFGLGERSQVVELASNDGYLLQYFVERGVPVLGVEPAANVAEVAIEKRHSHRGGLLREADSHGACRARAASRFVDRQQRARPRPRPERLRGRDEGAARPGRRDHDGVPAPRAADRGAAVRHDLSRALLLLLAADGEAGVHGARPEHLRRRGAPDPWRLAADPRVPCGRRRALRERCGAKPGGTRGAGGPHRHRHLRRLRPGRATGEARDPRVAHRPQERGQYDRGLRSSGQGQHAAQLLRRRHRLHLVHGRPQPAQAGSVPAGQPHPDPGPGGDRARATGCRVHPALEHSRGDHGAAPIRLGLGRPVPGAGPRRSSCTREVHRDASAPARS